MMKTQIRDRHRTPPLAIQFKPQSQWFKPLDQRPVHDLLDGIDTPDLLLAKSFRGPDLFNTRRTQTRFGSLTSESDSLDSLIESYLKPEDMDECFCEAENTVHIMPTANGDTEVMLNLNEVNYLNQWSTETYGNSCLNCLSVHQSSLESYSSAVDQMEHLFMQQLITDDDQILFDQIQCPSTSLDAISSKSQSTAAVASMDTELMTGQSYPEAPVMLQTNATVSLNSTHFYEPSVGDFVYQTGISFPTTTAQFTETVATNMMVASNFSPDMINGLNNLNRQTSSSMSDSEPLVNIAADNTLYGPNVSMATLYQGMPSDGKSYKRKHSYKKKNSNNKKPLTGKKKIEYLEETERALRLDQMDLVSNVDVLEAEIFRLKSVLFEFGWNSEKLKHHWNNQMKDANNNLNNIPNSMVESNGLLYQ